ncbi:GNAT family N-acetyltransferase [Roseovarius dicentrarchi]|uniref:GNAT family N-acetyltransferase n=1 Tax=Roseovarius dicentrarchi TaxID=2250573 RepID=UPI000DEA7613|nr:GNAT family N-acetyltransferase [Roseovarius dicentrarchi]
MTPSGARRHVARIARGAADMTVAHALRAAAFGLPAPDRDPFDAACIHILIEDRRAGRAVGCFRMLPLASGAEVGRSYSATFYDLAQLGRRAGPMTELGRFCVQPGARDPDILRAAWGAITAHVDATGVQMLFGCTSFRGTDPAPYVGAFALLAQHHLAPPDWAPQRRAPRTVTLAPGQGAIDTRRAVQALPPLLRSYLAMGGKVSDHAVIDPVMNTLHVFTGVDIAAIPAARKRVLRADAAMPAGAPDSEA